jgi:hypothetical protein
VPQSRYRRPGLAAIGVVPGEALPEMRLFQHAIAVPLIPVPLNELSKLDSLIVP